MNLLLFIVILIFALFMVFGYVRGLVQSVCKMVLMVCALVITYIATPFVADALIENTEMANNIRGKIYKRLEGFVSEQVREEAGDMVGALDAGAVSSLTHSYMESDLSRNEEMRILQEIPFPQFMKDALIEHNNRDEKRKLNTSNFFDYIATYLARMIVRAIVFCVMMTFLIIIFTILAKVLAVAAHLPIVNSVNRIGGIMFGAVEAVLVVWALFVVVAMIAHTPLGVGIYRQVEENTFLSMLYERNMLMSLITIFK